MAKKKSEPQVSENPASKDKQLVDKKKSTTENTPEIESNDSGEATPVVKKAATKKIKASAERTPEIKEEAAPIKKVNKKAAEKSVTSPATPEINTDNMVSPQSMQSETLPAPLSAKPVKKASKRKSPVSKENIKQEEATTKPEPVTEATPEAVENIEPVTIAEDKNESLVHKLAHVAGHTHQIEKETTSIEEKKISFIINYYTKPGQSLFMTAHHPLFGNGNPDAALPMEFLDDQHWKAEVNIGAITEDIAYNYILKEEDGTLVYDGGRDKKITPSSYHAGSIIILDAWDFEGYYDNAFFTEPFKNVLLKNNITAIEYTEPETYTHTFKIKAPLLVSGQVACLTGSSDALKNWNINEPFLMHKKENEEYWQVNLDLSKASLPLSYKYGLYDVAGKELIQLENGDNRVLNDGGITNTETIVNDGFIRTADTTWKGAGVAVPVFSLRTGNSFGCGEFADIKKLVDWSKSVGLKLIQLLPVNDTTSTKTWRDSYPYAAISAFALHAMYLNPDALVSEGNKNIIESYRDEAKRLNELPSVDYEAVNDMKWKIIHDVYPLQKEATFAFADYQSFFEDNKHWLVPYAAFCVLRDKFGTADVSKWNEFKNFDENAIYSFIGLGDEKDKLGMYYFVQYHLHLQLKEAAEYAHSHGIVIKGDIAIGVARNGADTWQHPDLFNLDMQAGAPPDPFAVKGQNWGFPTYKWQRMKENGFAWWKQRFSQMSNYFDAFRIDHILGFFRIWSIPTDSVEGIMGHFIPALPVHINEFQQWNTYFDYKRYTKPFINDQIIADLCGDQQQYVKDTFLVRDAEDNTYSLKPEVATQKRVETYFAIREQNAHTDWLKQLLFDLISNVILFEEKGSNGQLFHFRFGMEKTLSYQYMDNWSKHQLYFLSVNYFYERQDEFWRQEALQKLPALKAETDMLICGEDLGLVPASVPRVMQDLGLLSLEVQRMPKAENTIFTNLEKAPYLSVVTPATHDMSTIRGWWEEDRNAIQKFYNNQLGRWGEAPQHCEPDINKQIVAQHLYSPAMWSIFQWQDLVGMDGNLRRPNPNEERINVPAIPNYYWQYRTHISLEDFMNADKFNDELKEMIMASGR